MRTSWRFWAIIASLMITGLMSALEGTIITSALPTITEALGADLGMDVVGPPLAVSHPA